MSDSQQSPWVGYLILFIVFAVLVSMCGTCGDDVDKATTPEKSERVELSQTEEDLINQAEASGYVRFESGSRDVYVKPVFWYAMNHTAKKNFGAICAVKCGNADGSTTYYCNIIDDMTGKKLAEYSETWGLEIEE
jgi:hypothetical protein